MRRLCSEYSFLFLNKNTCCYGILKLESKGFLTAETKDGKVEDRNQTFSHLTSD